MPNKIDVIGRRFGRLTVEAEGPRQGTRRTVICICECGSSKAYDPRSLLSGKVRSCSCYQKEVVAAISSSRASHGKSKTAVYNIWIKMKSRCANQNDAKYVDYGGRGICVCSTWKSDFEAFLADMGPRPSAMHSIDRIDVNGNYEPSNCRWATPKEQSRNKRNNRIVHLMGIEMPLSEACELTGVNYRSALSRVRNCKPWLPSASTPTAPSQA